MVSKTYAAYKVGEVQARIGNAGIHFYFLGTSKDVWGLSLEASEHNNGELNVIFPNSLEKYRLTSFNRVDRGTKSTICPKEIRIVPN